MKSKHILILIPHLAVGGTEVQTLNLVRSFVLGGYKVTTLCLYRCVPQMVNAFEEAGSRVICKSPKYNHYGVQIHYHCGYKLLLFLYRTLKQALQEDNYSFVHVQYMTPMATAILVLRYLLNYKNIICTVHTNADIYSDLGLFHYIYNHCCRVFTCITEHAECSFFGSSSLYSKEAILGQHNHFTIYNSLPYKMQFCNKKRERIVNGDIITVGVVSRLELIKGMDLVVPAMNIVCQKHANVRLLVVGDGTLRSQIERTLTGNLVSMCEFVGRQDQNVLHKWYRMMDVVLMPSRSEGFGLTAIEAMANGCVVVASKTGGLPEVVKDGEIGLLHQPESVEDLAEKILQLVEDSDTLNSMRFSVQKYVKRFSFEKYTESINDLYSKL